MVNRRYSAENIELLSSLNAILHDAVSINFCSSLAATIKIHVAISRLLHVERNIYEACLKMIFVSVTNNKFRRTAKKENCPGFAINY